MHLIGWLYNDVGLPHGTDILLSLLHFVTAIDGHSSVKLFGSLATQMRRCAVAAASSETSEMERPTL